MIRLGIVLLMSIFISCNKSDPNFTVVQSKTSIAVASNNHGPIKINESKKNEIENLEKLEEDGLAISFDSNDEVQSVQILNGNYRLKTGIGIGSEKYEVISQYGKPIREDIPILKGKRRIGLIDVLTYKNGIFLLDKDKKVKRILVGDTKRMFM